MRSRTVMQAENPWARVAGSEEGGAQGPAAAQDRRHLLLRWERLDGGLWAKAS